MQMLKRNELYDGFDIIIIIMCNGNIALNIDLCSKTANEECPQSHTWKENSTLSKLNEN